MASSRWFARTARGPCLAHARDWPPLHLLPMQDVTAVAVRSHPVAARLASFSFGLELPRGIRAMQGMR